MFRVWGGVSGAQTTLPLVLTHGAAEGLPHARAAERPCGRLVTAAGAAVR